MTDKGLYGHLGGLICIKLLSVDSGKRAVFWRIALSEADTRKVQNLTDVSGSQPAPLNLTTLMTSNGHTTVLIKRVSQSLGNEV